MVKIKKVASSKHEATISPALSDFIKTLADLPLQQIPQQIAQFPPRWPFPRGDLYHWIPVLNRFDQILDSFAEDYGLREGPQTQDFGVRLLAAALETSQDVEKTAETELAKLGFGPEGDRELVETILNFSRILLENCGNRSLYASSAHLDSLLNTTSLSLLSSTLRLTARLAQRYYAACLRVGSLHHVNNNLLTTHYNIDVEKIHKLAQPFIKAPTTSDLGAAISPTTPTPKGKDKLITRVPVSVQATDLIAIAKSHPKQSMSHGRAGSNETDIATSSWEEWGSISLPFYPSSPEEDSKLAVQQISLPSTQHPTPVISTPSRRSAARGHPVTPLQRSSTTESVTFASSGALSSAKVEEQQTSTMRTLDISASQIRSTPITELLKSHLLELPQDSRYDLLTRARNALALTTSHSTRCQILAIRILAITNLAYVHPEETLQKKILQQDSDEPRRLQLAWQLADLIQPMHVGTENTQKSVSEHSIPRWLQTMALGCLEALARQKSRSAEVCSALNVNVGHGVLLYVLRKAIASLATEGTAVEENEEEEWREALFSLLIYLPSVARTGEALVTAGLLPILVEALTHRSDKAERCYPKVLNFLDTFVYNVRDAFQTLANARGLDIISELTSYEVDLGLKLAENGKGMPNEFRTPVIDYKIPFLQQQTLRWLFKFMNHMMTHTGANFDRLLRNLIDSPPLLNGLRTVLANAKTFGSNVWSGAVLILTSFINNEPTSYAVIVEAGLSKALLEAVTGRELLDEAKIEGNGIQSPSSNPDDLMGDLEVTEHPIKDDQSDFNRPTLLQWASNAKPEGTLAQGMIAAADAIATVPGALSAICLNPSGVKLFQASDVLSSFFEIFQSPEHLKCLDSTPDLPQILGTSFDELVRHHPQLRDSVMKSVINMVWNVSNLCHMRTLTKGAGAKLWYESEDSQICVCGGWKSVLGDLGHASAVVDRPLGSKKVDEAGDVEMEDSAKSDTNELSDLLTIVGVEQRSAPTIDVVKEKEDKKLEDVPVVTYIDTISRFLTGFFSNANLASLFVEKGGFDIILDIITSPSLPYDFNTDPNGRRIAEVVHQLVEQKPHLLLAPLLKRTQLAVDTLDSFSHSTQEKSFFGPLTDHNLKKIHPTHSPLKSIDMPEVYERGTDIVKSLVEVHTLSNVLLETLSAPMYNHHRSSYTLISQVNLTELHIKLVKSLGRLSSSCIWEEILLQQTIPDSWKEATRLRGPGLGNDDANNILGFLHGDEEPNEALNGENSSLGLEPTGEGSRTIGPSKTKATLERDTTDAQFKNVRTLRYLLSQIPSSITPFFQSLGKALIPKRSTDTQPRQNGALIAGAMAEAMLEQLRFPNSSDSLTAQDRYSYWIVTLTSLSQYLMDDQVLMERPHPQCLTLVLQAFKNQGGLEIVIDILRTFVGEVERLAPSSGETSSAENAPALLTSAYGGIKIILTLFSQIVNSRNIVDAVQTTSMMSRHNDREKPDYFLAQQFIVELRMAILPVVREVWDSTFMDKASSSLAKNMIEILKTILESGNEDGAFKRSDKVTLRLKTELKPWKFNLDHLNKLVNDSKFDQALAREALYRCYGNFNLAQEYCRTHTDHPRLTRNYIPEQEILRQSRSRDPREGSSSRLEISVSNSGDAGERSQSSAATSTTNELSPATEQPHAEAAEVAAEGSMPPPPPPALTVPAEDTEANEQLLAMSIDNLGGDASSLTRDPASEVADAASRKELGPRIVANVDDLNDERASLRTNLVERSLNVLHFHGDVTFELSDLMTAAVSAVSQSSEKESMRKEIGSTLVLSLTSLQSDDGDLPKVGKRIASYAHLLGLILQDKTFYDATLPELRDNLSVLLGFVKTSPDNNAETNGESSIQDSQAGSPWISHILLVIEKLLAEDAQPRPIKWQPPSSDVAAIATQEPYELAVSSDEKQQLLNAIMDILPSIGRDESLALSAVRILVILTRDWKLASQLKERSHLQRLLGMMQKMAGKTTDKLQGSIILVLRHIIEDKDVIRQIMRSEIRGFFNGRLDMEIPRQPRQHDTNLYMRNLSHSILRSPELFVDVTNELVKLTKFDPSQRHQSLALKPTETPGKEEDKGSDQKPSEEILATGSRENKPAENTNRTLQPPSDAREAVQAEKAKTSEVKILNIPPTDGVIHFLLSETLKYKDLEDKEPSTSSKNSAESRQDQTNSEIAIDIDMIHDGGSIARTSSPVAASSSAPEPNRREKIVFKAEHHPNFVYRCFLLQCLTELLVSYNCTKTEFLNFRQRAPHTQPLSTPSRPRSSVLSYLLHDVIPTGTLEHGEDLNFRKRQTISSCALNVVVALCSITDERGSLGETRTPVGDMPWMVDQAELTHVRKVVLDTSLKAYKDANSSMEPLGLKYSRMLNISELFNRFLLKNNLTGSRNVDPGVMFASQKELARMMFERGFIPALTNSLADIDLNFPQAKRLVKYILRPLKGLTDIAIELSQMSNPPVILGQLDIDDASSASSVSVIEDDREETPDLFRNSTLGMFEPGGQEHSSSESEDDEEMYDGDDGYGDEMDYEEEMGDSGDVVSDDDEDLDGVGPIEGLPGDVGVNLEVVIDEDDETDEDDESSDSNDNDDIEVVDSLNGHQDGASDVEPGDHEWTDEAEDFEGVADDDGDDDEDDEDDPDLVGDMGDAARDILGALRDSEPPMLGGDLVMNMEGEGYMEDDMDDEEDQDDEEMDDDDVFYEPEYDDDDLEDAELRWGWDSERPPPVMAPRRTHHHHHHRGPSPWSMFHGLPREQHLAPPTYRSRGAGIPATRPSDEGINPLLQRNSIGMPGSSTRIGYPEAMSDWVHAIDPGRPSHGILNADSQVSFIYNIFNAMNQGRNHLGTGPIDPHGEGLAFHISPGSRGTIPRELHNLFGMRHLQSEAPRVAVDDPSEAIVFAPGSTSRRWTEESRILFGLNPLDKTQLILNALLSVLVPPALAEAEIQRLKDERDSAEAAKKIQEEVIAQEEAARKEKEAKELEARTAAAQAAAEVAAAAAIQAQTQQNDQSSSVIPEVTTGTARGTVPEVIPEATNEQVSVDQPMEDADPAQAEQPPANAEAGPSENPAARVFVNFHGRQIDITDLAIDPEYLDALPEEMREEVLVQQFAEHRSQAAESGEPPPTDLDRDFLEALPDEIREELLQHEADERRRRERDEARRQAAETGTVAPQDNEMDPADFLASLDPGLRQSVLLESPEEMINQLPPELAAEARALGGDRRLRQFMDGGSRLGRGRGLEHDERHLVRPERRTSRKTIVQMLDKPGVATLLRLMFIPQQGSSRSLLSSTLRNVCENRQNRIEVVSLLLSILQDGSADMNAVERSFNRLSLRARQPAVPPKDKMALERPAMLQGSLANSEISPLTVVQQCLGTLVSLTQHNHRDLSLFFLTEHDPPSALKRNRKGKGKDVKSSKYALNALLVLLDRKLIMESSNAMEQLSQLLNTITQPLGLLLREGIVPKPPNETLPTEETQTVPPLANGTETNPEQQQQNLRSEPTNATGSNSNGVNPESEQTQTGVLPQNVMEHTQEQGTGSLSGEPTATLLNTNGMEVNPEHDTEDVGAEQASNERTVVPEQKPEDERTKKTRIFNPPIIPEENLRLVVNILAARECSGKTFRETLSTINNLSRIPGTKIVFGQELHSQADDLAQLILGDLTDLLAQIDQAEPDTDVQGLALAKFSPASSDQAKFLRILTALDYINDPKHGGDRDKSLEASSSATSDPTRFGPLWTILSRCLTEIHKRPNMLNAATILLPLIEALMVVCQNTTLKDAPAPMSQEFAVSSPPPEDRIESLFFKFTEDHRKILNDLVRHNPKLMSGNFSLLVKNPKVLEFDNKRNYFNRRLHSRGNEIRQPQPPLALSLRREYVFLDSFKSLYFKTGKEMKYGKLSIRFHGEEGVDAGGVTREWFQALARQMFDSNYVLFTPVASDRTTFHPNRLSVINEQHLMFFKFIGRIIGKALYEGRVLDCHFSRAVYKRILGKTVSVKDMETLDLDYYKSLKWMLDNDITDIITETFSLETDDFGKTNIIDLKPDGRNIPVTEENKQEYVQLVVEHRLTGSVKEQLENFLTGFHDIVPAELISIFNEQELELLISGLPDIDVDDWKSNTEYHGYTNSSKQIQWFWRAVRSFDKEERAKLLQFVTGTSKVPLNGFKDLEGMNGISRFNIHRDYGNKDRLPSSHTCFNQLDLPEYDGYEALRKHVHLAITAGNDYFGFA